MGKVGAAHAASRKLPRRRGGVAYDPAYLQALQFKELVSIDEAAWLMGVGHTTIRALIKAGDLPSVRVSERSLVPMVAIRERVEGAMTAHKGRVEQVVAPDPAIAGA